MNPTKKEQKKKELTENELLILGMTFPFEEKGITGKDMEILIEERDVRRWTNIGFSSIYYILDQLERKKLLVSRSDKMGHAKRGAPAKPYFITDKGKEVLRKSIKEYLSERLEYKEFMIVLAVSQALNHEELVPCLIEYRSILINWLEDQLRPRYKKVKSEYPGELAIHIWGIFNHSITLLEANIKFLGHLIEMYEQSITKQLNYFS
ncbi:MAG: PadR family transcriptional regulator [Candidatus Hodarchaeota archaeon]